MSPCQLGRDYLTLAVRKLTANQRGFCPSGLRISWLWRECGYDDRHVALGERKLDEVDEVCHLGIDLGGLQAVYGEGQRMVPAAGCRIEHGLALRRNQQIKLRVGVARQSTDREAPSQSLVTPTYDLRFGREHRTLEVGEALELRARWHGWFRLELSSDYGSAAKIEVSLAAP